MVTVIFLSILALSFVLLAHYLVLTVARGPLRAGPVPDLPSYPFVSILKPMKNIDDGLEENLRSFFTLDYPAYEIIFGVDTLEDACVGVIEQARKQYPSVKTTIIQTSFSKAVNPKVDKLAKMSQGLKSPLFWVSDSNTRVEKNTLALLVGEYLGRGSKIVFSPIRGAGGRSPGSIMANSYLNVFVSGNILSAWSLFDKPIIVGKSMLLERETLERLGGFTAFDCYLAEDYMMGAVYSGNGVYISTNYTWVTNFSSTTSVSTFYSRMARWAKMRFRIDPFFYCLEILANPSAIAFISIFFMGMNGAKLLAAVFALQTIIEYLHLFVAGGGESENIRVLLIFPFCSAVKDAMLLMVYFTSFFSRTVQWHGRKIVIGKDSRIDKS